MVVTPANAHDATAIFDLLAPVVDEDTKPTVMGDSAYASAGTLDDLEQAGFADILARSPRPGDARAVSARTTSTWTWEPQPSPARPGR